MTANDELNASKRSNRGIGAVLLAIACAAACALPVLGGLIAGTVVDRFLDLPGWALGAIVLAVGAVTYVMVRRRATARGC